MPKTDADHSPREAAGFFSRLFAYNIDITLLMGVYLLCSFLTSNNTILYGLCLTFTFFYFAVLESSDWQGTVGKKYSKLQVVDKNGYPLTIGLASLRSLLKFMSVFLLVIAIFIIYFRRDRRSLHDLILGTQVVRIS